MSGARARARRTAAECTRRGIGQQPQAKSWWYEVRCTGSQVRWGALLASSVTTRKGRGSSVPWTCAIASRRATDAEVNGEA